jgi:hypothetical protein
MSAHDALPATFAATREALHALACYVIAPARLASDGHIGLRPVEGGIGTPWLEDGSRVRVSGAYLVVDVDGVGCARPITTLRDAAALAGVALDPRPPVGSDLPPFEPDAALPVDRRASLALGSWYALGSDVLDRLTPPDAAVVSERQLWPEHFDLAVVVTPGRRPAVNVGFGPGDSFSDEPYVYVGPFDRTGLDDAFWNAPFGAFRTRRELLAGGDPVAAAGAFIADGLARAVGTRSGPA